VGKKKKNFPPGWRSDCLAWVSGAAEKKAVKTEGGKLFFAGHTPIFFVYTYISRLG